MFSSGLTLDSQGGWVNYPTNEVYVSQVLDGAFTNSGQQALIGYVLPTTETNSVSAYRFLDFDPVAAGRPLVVFEVRMAILHFPEDANRDDFRWSVYNRQGGGERLLSLSFDNQTTRIYQILDDGTDLDTGQSFARDTLYQLQMVLHFGSNWWSARLNGIPIVDHAPMTTTSRTLDLGDIDAVWVRGSGPRFGTNYMAFDDYRVVADVGVPAPPRLELLSFFPNGDVPVRLTGPPSYTYLLESSADLANWTPRDTNTPSSGVAVYIDAGARQRPRQFYRGRLLWP